MKKLLAMCAAVALLMGATLVSTVSAAHAQASGPFADVPTDHWAYQAVDTLQKAGIVIGYPDGTYGGKRAMTRYEFATAIARLLPLIKPPDLSPYAKQSDLDALRTDLQNRLQQNQAALDALTALVNEFKPELEQLGQDVAAIKTRLSALESRVAAVEAEQRRVRITGDTNFIFRSNLATGGQNAAGLRVQPIDQNGYRIGSTTSKSLFSNPNFYHDVLLTVTGQVSDTASAVVQIEAGNYLPTIGNATGYSPTNLDGNGTAPADGFNIYKAYLDAPVALGPLGGAEAVVGRFGQQFTDYTLKAINPDVYATLPENASGDVIEDGAKLNFKLGPTSETIFAAKNAPIDGYSISAGPSVNARNGAFRPGSATVFGGEPGGSSYANNVIDESFGARVTFGTPDSFVLGATALLARTTGIDGDGVDNTDPDKFKPYNNIQVYGADFNGGIPFAKLSGLTLNGQFAINPTGENSRLGNVNNTKGNEAYDARLGYTFGAATIKAGYREVYANFNAPGYWGRIGSWTNPTNIRGAVVNASYTFNPSLSLVADGNFYQGRYDVGEQSPLGKNDKLNQFDVGLKYGITAAYGLDLGYEYVQWDLKGDQTGITGIGSGKPTEQYITLGIGHALNKNSSVKVLYQIIDYKDKGTGFDPSGDSKGGVALTQFALKF